MVKKIKDPRYDDSALSMRVYRAEKVLKYIKTQIHKNVVEFEQDKFSCGIHDEKFLEDFKSSPHSIQQELVFLWEEVGDLKDKINNFNSSSEK